MVVAQAVDLQGREIPFAVIAQTARSNWREHNGPHYGECFDNARLIAAAPEMYNALNVITLEPKIRAWLAANDPKALEQAGDAITKAEGGQLK
jgi:hypothetical protein